MVTMLAAVYEREGSAADVLRVRELQRPEPGPGEVRVRVAVSAVNPTDVKTRAGHTSRPIDGFRVPHVDGAGTIDAVGPGVDPARVGQRVWLLKAGVGSPWGTAAQWSVVPSANALELPAAASFDLGATLGVPAMTAAACLFADGPIDGRTVLVAGGAGAVGRAAVQLAAWGGARVCATVSSAAKAEIALAAGADAVVDYRAPDAIERLRAWSAQVDRVVELALGPNLDLDLAVSAPGTVVVTYAIDGPDPVLPIRRCMVAGVTLRFFLLYTAPPAVVDLAIDTVRRAVADRALDLPPVTRFGLDDIVAAHEAQESGVVGKVLVDIPG